MYSVSVLMVTPKILKVKLKHKNPRSTTARNDYSLHLLTRKAPNGSFYEIHVALERYAWTVTIHLIKAKLKWSKKRVKSLTQDTFLNLRLMNNYILPFTVLVTHVTHKWCSSEKQGSKICSPECAVLLAIDL